MFGISKNRCWKCAGLAAMSDKMTNGEKEWIDSAGYEQLLSRLRFAPASAHVAASKHIGWEP